MLRLCIGPWAACAARVQDRPAWHAGVAARLGWRPAEHCMPSPPPHPHPIPSPPPALPTHPPTLMARLQVLFFCPPMRDALMRHVPEPSTEFSLTCEMSLLFRMLATAASGTVCQVGAARQRVRAAGRPAVSAGRFRLPACCPTRAQALGRRVPDAWPTVREGHASCVAWHTHSPHNSLVTWCACAVHPTPPACRPPTCFERYARTRRPLGLACWRV